MATLYLLPNLLGDEATPDSQWPGEVAQVVGQLDGLIAEDPKMGRKFLKHFTLKKPIQEIPVEKLDKYTNNADIDELLESIEGNWGVVSDAGVPCVADPGHQLVAGARRRGIPVKGLVGPCSFLHALMLSGLPAQAFAFHGYLPRKEQDLIAVIRKLDIRAKKERATQIAMEVPYRNEALLSRLVSTLDDDTRLVVGIDLTLPTEEIHSYKVHEWKSKFEKIDIRKRPAVFLFR